MAWWIQPQEIATKDGKPSGRWRMTAKSDEGGGGPYGDVSHDHATAEEAEACNQCDEYVHRWAGFPSRKQSAEAQEKRERAEYERLKAKYGSDATASGYPASGTIPLGAKSQESGR